MNESLAMLIALSAATASPLDDNNAIRARYGKPPMVIDARLQAAAQDHANYMAANRSMNHFSNGGPQARAAKQGFRGGVAENIAMGAANPWSMWVNSPGHFRSIIGNYNACGIAVAYSGSTPYWCAVYGNATEPAKPPIIIPTNPPTVMSDADFRALVRKIVLEILAEQQGKQPSLGVPPIQQLVNPLNATGAFYSPVPQYQPAYQPQYGPPELGPYGGCIGGRCGRR